MDITTKEYTEHRIFSELEQDWPAAFPTVDGRQLVNIDGFLTITGPAVARFLERVSTLIPVSQQEDNIRKKR